MARQENLYPECNVDTNLMGYIVGGKVKHKGCCNDVMKVLNSTTQFAIGVIDEDKRQPTIDPGFLKYEFRSSYNKTHISFYPHNDGSVFFSKSIRQWISLCGMRQERWGRVCETLATLLMRKNLGK